MLKVNIKFILISMLLLSFQITKAQPLDLFVKNRIGAMKSPSELKKNLNILKIRSFYEVNRFSCTPGQPHYDVTPIYDVLNATLMSSLLNKNTYLSEIKNLHKVWNKKVSTCKLPVPEEPLNGLAIENLFKFRSLDQNTYNELLISFIEHIDSNITKNMTQFFEQKYCDSLFQTAKTEKAIKCNLSIYKRSLDEKTDISMIPSLVGTAYEGSTCSDLPSVLIQMTQDKKSEAASILKESAELFAEACIQMSTNYNQKLQSLTNKIESKGQLSAWQFFFFQLKLVQQIKNKNWDEAISILTTKMNNADSDESKFYFKYLLALSYYSSKKYALSVETLRPLYLEANQHLISPVLKIRLDVVSCLLEKQIPESHIGLCSVNKTLDIFRRSTNKKYALFIDFIEASKKNDPKKIDLALDKIKQWPGAIEIFFDP